MDAKFTFPSPSSMTEFEAAKWYRSMVPQIPNIKIDEACWESERQIPVAEFKSHWDMKSRLRFAAALALFDQQLVDEFLQGFPLPSVNEYLGAAFAITQDKSAFELALSNLLEITEVERRHLNPDFFVHVGDGLYKKYEGQG